MEPSWRWVVWRCTKLQSCWKFWHSDFLLERDWLRIGKECLRSRLFVGWRKALSLDYFPTWGSYLGILTELKPSKQNKLTFSHVFVVLFFLHMSYLGISKICEFLWCVMFIFFLIHSHLDLQSVLQIIGQRHFFWKSQRSQHSHFISSGSTMQRLSLRHPIIASWWVMGPRWRQSILR